MQRCGLVPVNVRGSCGWPSRGGLGQHQAVIGQCFGPQVCTDGVPQIFVSPRLAENVEVLGVLLHELVHASVEVQYKHLAPFSQAARKVGLVGVMATWYIRSQNRRRGLSLLPIFLWHVVLNRGSTREIFLKL